MKLKDAHSSPKDWVTMNPDIMVKPSFALMPRFSKVVLFKCLTIMSEFFLGAMHNRAIPSMVVVVLNERMLGSFDYSLRVRVL